MVKQQRRNTGLGNNSLSNVLHIAAWAELCFAPCGDLKVLHIKEELCFDRGVGRARVIGLPRP